MFSARHDTRRSTQRGNETGLETTKDFERVNQLGSRKILAGRFAASTAMTAPAMPR